VTTAYITVDDLLAGARSRARLAEAAAPDDTDVDGEILAVALADGDLSAHNADTRAAARQAAAWVRDEVAAANRIAAAHIEPRHGVVDAATAPGGLKVYTLDIARYRIFGGAPDSEDARRHDAAMLYFRGVAAGGVDLNLPAAAADASRPVAQVSAPAPHFGDGGLAGAGY